MKKLILIGAIVMASLSAQADLLCSVTALKAKSPDRGFGWNFLISLGYSFDNRADLREYQKLVDIPEFGAEVGIAYTFTGGENPVFEAYLCNNSQQSLLKNCNAENIFDRIILRPGQSLHQQFGNYLFSANCQRIPEPKI